MPGFNDSGYLENLELFQEQVTAPFLQHQISG